DRAHFGVVPIENSTEGVVSYTLDMFMDFDLYISGEIMLEISHNLLSITGERSKIKRIYSHPQATAQCRRWLEKNMPGIEIIEATSTAKAAELASKDPEGAAIAGDLAAQYYNLEFVERHIEDFKDNYTRFLVISKTMVPRTGRDKTSIMVSLKDRPGALHDLLTPFKDYRINLTKIESRPSKLKAWQYIFFIDLEGHTEDSRVKKALEKVKDICVDFRILGSYPRYE
ncbi:MAG: prephenate dehydratase, partial [Thermodesulfovibrionales bacterium]|nr:prephenate dehydratase [Thermodesulfovibrionales bacterium]